jgi:hypothetical protein
LSPLYTSATRGPTVPTADGDCDIGRGAFGRTRTGRRNRSTWKKSVPVSLCAKQIAQDLTWDRTKAFAKRGTLLWLENIDLSDISTIFPK